MVRNRDQGAKVVDREITAAIERAKNQPTPSIPDSEFSHRVFTRKPDPPQQNPKVSVPVDIKKK